MILYSRSRLGYSEGATVPAGMESTHCKPIWIFFLLYGGISQVCLKYHEKAGAHWGAMQFRYLFRVNSSCAEFQVWQHLSSREIKVVYSLWSLYSKRTAYSAIKWLHVILSVPPWAFPAYLHEFEKSWGRPGNEANINHLSAFWTIHQQYTKHITTG